MSKVKQHLMATFYSGHSRRLFNSNMLKTAFSHSMMPTCNTVGMCVKNAINVQLKQLYD